MVFAVFHGHKREPTQCFDVGEDVVIVQDNSYSITQTMAPGDELLMFHRSKTGDERPAFLGVIKSIVPRDCSYSEKKNYLHEDNLITVRLLASGQIKKTTQSQTSDLLEGAKATQHWFPVAIDDLYMKAARWELVGGKGT